MNTFDLVAVDASSRLSLNSGILPRAVREHLNILNRLDMLSDTRPVGGLKGKRRRGSNLKTPSSRPRRSRFRRCPALAVRLSRPTLLPVRDVAATCHRTH